ncbi:hypothetical protein OF83DRAFT_1172890 [Amylostereum chailletii]|nr:hypothetical protein OF83DRAFT_1172890 [Amylostereum chailletii]
MDVSPATPTPASQRGTSPRTLYPKSKTKPDLYRIAIKGHMRTTVAGQKILYMGPRLAVSLLTATRELELLIAENTITADESFLRSLEQQNL